MGVARDHSILIACIGAGAAIVAALAKPICEAFIFDKPQPTPVAAAAAPASPAAPAAVPITPTPYPLEGVWKQFVLDPVEGDVYVGTFVVGRSGGGYVISPRTQIEGERVEHSLGVFDVAYDGQTWTYNSNWGNGKISSFQFRRVSPTVFEGEIRVAGRFEGRTRVVKIE
jgi:hypothetical protein